MSVRTPHRLSLLLSAWILSAGPVAQAEETSAEQYSPELPPAEETVHPAPPPSDVVAPEADASWQQFLDGLEEPGVEMPTTPVASVVEPPSSTRARAVAGGAFLVLLLGAHPAVRRRLRTFGVPRGDAAADQAPRLGERIDLGAGRSLQTVEVDGRRLLLGMGPKGFEVLDRWDLHAPAAADAKNPPIEPLVKTDIADLEVAPEADVETAEPQAGTNVSEMFAKSTASVTPAPARRTAMRRASAELRRPAPEVKTHELPTPAVEELLSTWRAAARRLEHSPTPEVPVDDEDTPWWLEGACADERARLEEAARPPHIQSPPPAAAAAVPTPRRRRPWRPQAPATEAPRSIAPAVRAAETRPRKRAVGERRTWVLALAFAFAMIGAPDIVFAAEVPLAVEFGGEGTTSAAVRLLAGLTLLAVLPAIVLSMTSFTRLIVVFSLLRQALSVQQAPPNQILIGLALFLTWFVMGPTFERVHEDALTPYMDGEMSEMEAVDAAMVPMRDFMLKHTRHTDLALFLEAGRMARPNSPRDVPTRVLVPAFLISELKTGFEIGFLLYIPFLVIDLVVSTILLAMGMMVLPPVVISLPFKLMLFVFVDGWNLLIGSLVQGFA